MRRIRFTDGAAIVSGHEPDPLPGRGQVVVAARFAGVNGIDLLARDRGEREPGVEVAGRVVAAGDGAVRWAVGDRVMGLVTTGGLADRVLVPEAHLLPVPDDLDERAAAAMPEAVITAYDALLRARVVAGERVLIRGANGGVGIAAVQIANDLGADAVGSVRDPGLVEALGALGVAAVPQDGLAATDGFDAVVDLVGGRFVADDLALLRTGGRIVVVAATAGDETTLPLGMLMAKRADVMGTVLRPRSDDEKAVLFEDVRQRVLPLIASGRVAVPVDAVIPAERADDAYARLLSAGKLGKVLIDFGDQPTSAA